MAMFPNAAQGYMPFITGKNVLAPKNKRSKLNVNSGTFHPFEVENHKQSGTAKQKMYQITLKDKKGNTYKCVVKTDGTHSLPTLCDRSVPELVSTYTHRSMPDITLKANSPSQQRLALTEKLQAQNNISDSGENFSMSLDLRNCGKKKGFISAIINFFKPKTSKTKIKTDTCEEKAPTKHKNNGKSKRKPTDTSQRKRQRTVSAMSNLDPIEESPNEQEFENDDEDNNSYRHYGSSCSSDYDSVSSSIT